jgi:hypothetical protein
MQNKNARMAFRCSSELRKKIQKEAETLEWTMSDMIVEILETWFSSERNSDGEGILQEIDELIAKIESEGSREGNRERQTE